MNDTTDLDAQAMALADDLKARIEPLQAAQKQLDQATEFMRAALANSGNVFSVYFAAKDTERYLPATITRVEADAMLEALVRLRTAELESQKRTWTTAIAATFGADAQPPGQAINPNLKRGGRGARR